MKALWKNEEFAEGMMTKTPKNILQKTQEQVWKYLESQPRRTRLERSISITQRKITKRQ